MSRPAIRFALLTVLALGVPGCGSSEPRTPTGPTTPPPSGPVMLTPVAATAEWPSSTPDAEGVDPAPITDLVGRIRRGEYGRIHTLLIVRNDRLVVEEYFNWSSVASHTQQSVTKSVTSLAAGLAVDRGLLGIDDRVTPLFSDYQPIAAFDANKQGLTVRDLLTMRTGFDWSEQAYQGSPLERLNTCACDWIRFTLDWRLREPPGSRFEYVSGGTILLGAVIGRATGSRVDVWLESELFAPLGFQDVQWSRGQPAGLPHTGGGLFLRARDMAKIGTLVLNGGRWQGRQLISESWIRESTATRPEIASNLAGRPATYGYLWWGLPNGIITASGARGQWIFVVPQRQLVVVSNAENADTRASAAVQFLYDVILPAVR